MKVKILFHTGKSEEHEADDTMISQDVLVLLDVVKPNPSGWMAYAFPLANIHSWIEVHED